MMSGGLGLRSLISLNEASNLKFGWELVTSSQSWAIIIRKRAIKNRKSVNYHIFSSIWSSVKSKYQSILDNSEWILGSGDSWCGPALSNFLNFPPNNASQLIACVSDFIVNFQWCFPPSVSQVFPQLLSLFNHTTIPKVPLEDNLVWAKAKTGNLTLKEAYLHKSPIGHKLHWARRIWSADIPPTKSLLSWRIMHDRVPTDDKLRERGCSLASVCSNYLSAGESTIHLFFQCNYACKLWSWFSSLLNINLQFADLVDIWKVCDRNWTPQCKVAITACIINILSTIWYSRNQSRYYNKKIFWKSTINLIISSVALSGNLTRKASAVDMAEFVSLKTLKLISTLLELH